LTYSIAIFPFYQTDNPWEKAVFRVLNVAIGSVIGTVGSVIVLPRSTSSLLLKRIQDQCKLAGESAEAVLHAAADVFSGEMAPLKFSELLQEPKVRLGQRRLRRSILQKSFRRINKDIIDEGGDVALEKYESAIKEWRVTKGLFSLLRYDPFHYFMECKDDFKNGCAITLGRALRVQTTVVLMDGIIRNDLPHSFDDDLISMFTEMGTLTRKMFKISPELDASEAAKDLLLERLAIVRANIGMLAHALSDTEAVVISRRSNITKRSQRRRSIVMDDGSNRQSLLFLQLVEHLILRCIALHDSWMEVEELPSSERFQSPMVKQKKRRRGKRGRSKKEDLRGPGIV
jgi:hypothetical protein